MYQAPIVALLFVVSHVWNHVGVALEKRGTKIPLFMHWYGFLYGALLYLFGRGCQEMYDDVLTPTNWLNHDDITHFATQTMRENGDYDESFDTWRNESSLSEFHGLREFSMLCPVFVFLTILVCIYHTHLHINKIRYAVGGAGRLCDCPQHDQTIKVLILPVVYGLMSFKSTTRMWMVMINHVPVPYSDHNTTKTMFSGYESRKEFLMEMYESNFMCGDIYETIALVTFGNLVMGVLKKKIDSMKEIFAEETAERADGKEMQDYINRLVDAMKTLTVAGVKLFALSCLLQGTYNLTVCTMGFYFPHFQPALFSREPQPGVDGQPGVPGLFQQDAIKATSHDFFLGAGFIASFAAIGNIMIIEEDFEELLKEFHPALKFWGTKILVSLAFLQSILITIFLSPNGWSIVQSNLFYSSALCLECLLIAIFHIKGWDAEEKWYGDYEVPNKEGKKGMQQPLLPAESK